MLLYTPPAISAPAVRSRRTASSRAGRFEIAGSCTKSTTSAASARIDASATGSVGGASQITMSASRRMSWKTEAAWGPASIDTGSFGT